MNKRFRELAKQAGIDFLECTNPEHGGREYCEAWTEQQQKFAELIVRECIDVLVDVLPDIVPEAKDGIHPIWHIKEHFGVEE